MQDFVEVTGMVIYSAPVGEYDRRVILLTKETGKITAFARGARKPNSKFLAPTNLFAFGEFKLYQGKSAYTLADVHITNFFDELRMDYDAALYGTYFLEIADYYTRENLDESQMLLLLYQSLRALSKEAIPNELVKCIYEMKAIVVNGEFPGVRSEANLLSDTVYAIEFVANEPLKSLYCFNVSKEVLAQLKTECDVYRKRFMAHEFKSLSILENCRLKM